MSVLPTLSQWVASKKGGSNSSSISSIFGSTQSSASPQTLPTLAQWTPPPAGQQTKPTLQQDQAVAVAAKTAANKANSFWGMFQNTALGALGSIPQSIVSVAAAPVDIVRQSNSPVGSTIRRIFGGTAASMPPISTVKGSGVPSLQEEEYANSAAGKPSSNASLVGKSVNAAADVVTSADLAGGVPDLIEKGASAVKGFLEPAEQWAKDKLTKLFVGDEGTKTLKLLNNPEAKKFVPTQYGGAGKVFGDVVKKTTDAVGQFVNDSKAALQKVKDSIPNVAIKGSEIATRVNQAIMNAIENNAAYKGVKGASEGLFKNVNDLIQSGLMNSDEARKVEGMVKTISQWQDNSARGLLNLKDKLSAFYDEGSNNSNRILRNIQSGLKDLVGEVAPEIKGALSTASKNIDKAEEFTRNLIGNTAVQGESKLSSIARGLNNPALNSEKLKLIQELKNLTGYNALPEMKGYADYLRLLAKDFPSKAGTIIGNVAKRVGITGGIAAATAGAVDYLKRLFTGQ